MPLSVAACRTVLPFSTVTWRPSIVSVTVSIFTEYCDLGLGIWDLTRRCHAANAPPNPKSHPFYLDVGERPVVLVEIDAAERAGQPHAVLDAALGDRHDHEGARVAIIERERERHVEHLAQLFDVYHEVGAVEPVRHPELRQRSEEHTSELQSQF